MGFDIFKTAVQAFEWFFSVGAANIFTNMPVALTEWNTNTQRRYTKSLVGLTEFRLKTGVTTIGAAGAVLGVQYSIDAGVTFRGLDNDTLGAISTIQQPINVAGNFVTARGAITDGAKVVDVLLRIVGSGGDGILDPAITYLILEFR